MPTRAGDGAVGALPDAGRSVEVHVPLRNSWCICQWPGRAGLAQKLPRQAPWIPHIKSPPTSCAVQDSPQSRTPVRFPTEPTPRVDAFMRPHGSWLAACARCRGALRTRSQRERRDRILHDVQRRNATPVKLGHGGV